MCPKAKGWIESADEKDKDQCCDKVQDGKVMTKCRRSDRVKDNGTASQPCKDASLCPLPGPSQHVETLNYVKQRCQNYSETSGANKKCFGVTRQGNRFAMCLGESPDDCALDDLARCVVKKKEKTCNRTWRCAWDSGKKQCNDKPASEEDETPLVQRPWTFQAWEYKGAMTRGGVILFFRDCLLGDMKEVLTVLVEGVV